MKGGRSDMPGGEKMRDERVAALFRQLPDARVRDELFEAFQPLAIHLAQRYARRGLEREDLTQVAFVGLINAIDRFDPNYGSRFISFAVPTITGEIKRHFRDASWGTGVPRRLKDVSGISRRVNEELTQRLGRPPTIDEIAEHSGLAPDDVVEAAALGSAYRPEALDAPVGDDDWSRSDALGEDDTRYALIEDLETLKRILATRSERDRQILHLRFYHELTQRQIADRVGVSQMHVSRILAACLEEMRLIMLA